MSNIPDKIQGATNKISDAVGNSQNNIADGVQNAKDNIKKVMPDAVPVPQGLRSQSPVNELKTRLEWGEPAFTILDVRDRDTFNDGHIMGAMSMPSDQLESRAKSSLEPNRDIYIYGLSDEDTARAANMLRQAGFVNVAELVGGFPAWKAIGGPTEGIIESRTPAGADDYNLGARLADHRSKS